MNIKYFFINTLLFVLYLYNYTIKSYTYLIKVASGNKNKVTVENFEIATGDTLIKPTTQTTQQDVINKGLTPILIANDDITELKSKKPFINNFLVSIPEPLSVKILNPAISTATDEPFFTDGSIMGKTTINGPVSSPDASGNIILDNITVPSKDTVLKHAIIDITKDNLILTDSDISIDDSQLKIYGIADKNFALPITFQKLEIQATELNLSGIKDVLSKSANINEESSQSTGTSKPLAETSPIIIQNGDINADEVILNALIGNNLYTNFTLTPDWLLSLPNLDVKAADGELTGNIQYNINSKNLLGKLIITGMNANAAASTFMNLPNEVYGTLDATSEFNTQGSTPKEMMSNANGFAQFTIKNGRLTRLGSIEYLLNAANIAKGGLAGFNLNEITNLIYNKKTGTFKIMAGTITAKNGVLTTDNLRSRGKNLSLLVKGSLRMSDNYADIVILGRLSKKVSGILGPIGSLSINTAIEYIPLIGFIPGEPTGLAALLPKIPILGLGGKGKHRHFVVIIKGNLYDPSSVKSFRWID